MYVQPAEPTFTRLGSSHRPRALGLLSALVLGGCASHDEILSNLVLALGEDTILIAEDAITASMVLGALSAELCTATLTDDALAASWLLSLEGSPPLSEGLLAALGDPQLDAIEGLSNNAIQATLSGARLLDEDDVQLRLTTEPSSTQLSLQLEAWAKPGSSTSYSRAMGVSAFEVKASCGAGISFLTGSSTWTDALEQQHTITIPPTDAAGVELQFQPGSMLYVPLAGSLSWTARIDEQARIVSTWDASHITLHDELDTASLPSASWPVDVGGGSEWTLASSMDIAP